MKSKMPIRMLVSGVLTTLFATLPMATYAASDVSKAEAEAIATEAYIYGYPLITMETTRDITTNVVTPKGTSAPMGQFVHMRSYPDASFTAVTAPNADTLYSVAWVDLSKEPYVLHVPDEKGRYYLMPMLSAWTNVFANPGTRTTGTKAADFVVTGPGWKGTLPPGTTEYKSPTNLIWILGRTYCTGTVEDYKEVHAIQDQYTLTPLSSFGKPYTPPNGVFNPDIDMKTSVRDQVNALKANFFFKKLAISMKDNPPSAEDAPMVAAMAKLGIIPGKEFDMSQDNTDTAKMGIEKIMSHGKEAGKVVNGWTMTTKTGVYGTDYLQRAYIAAIGLGANLPEDAIYPATSVDSKGKPLNGKKCYVLHFDKGQLPPAKGFWSLTMYNDQYFFIQNPLNRYSISPRNDLKTNPDGSVDLYLQSDSPGADKESNWLPAPKGQFVLMLRLYWPEESVLNGMWKPPAVKKVK